MNYEAKCFYYPADCAVHWELRRFVIGLSSGGSSSGALQLHKMLKHSDDLWFNFCDALDLDKSACCQQSTRAHSSRGGASSSDERFIRDEWTLSTEGLVAFLLSWCTLRRGGENRDRAKATLSSLAHTFTTRGRVLAEWVASLQSKPKECGSDCDENLERGLPCLHCLTVPVRTEPNNAMEFVAEFLADARMARHCQATAAIAKWFIQAFNAQVIAEVSAAQPGDPLQHPLVAVNGRLRRVDEDFRHDCLCAERAGKERTSGDRWQRPSRPTDIRALGRPAH